MALMERKLGPAPSEPAPDRAPDSLAGGTAQPLRGELEQLLGADRVLARASDIVRYASDASPYRLLPQVVVMARDAVARAAAAARPCRLLPQVGVRARDAEGGAGTLAFGKRGGLPVTSRPGGPSLNGQGQREGILVDVRRHFSGVAIESGAPREGG